MRKLNNYFRSKRPISSKDNACEVFQEGDLIEIGFISKQCKNDLAGTCLMCDYGHSKGTFENQIYINKMKEILSSKSEGMNFLLLCSNGSILDEYQISKELFIDILKIAQNCSIPNIIIETYYKDINVETLTIIKKYISKPVIIEMGLETANQEYQDLVLMKGINIATYEKTIELIHSFNFKIELNIMIGLPFFSLKEMFGDAIKTINWAIEKGCDPVLFPINIKPYTTLYYLYENELYESISLWLIVLILDELNINKLDKVIIAWYGNRDDSYKKNKPNIFPTSCNKCKTKLSLFFRNFLNSINCEDRKFLIKKLLEELDCNCLKKLKDNLDKEQNYFKENLQKFYDFILKKSNETLKGDN